MRLFLCLLLLSTGLHIWAQLSNDVNKPTTLALPSDNVMEPLVRRYFDDQFWMRAHYTTALSEETHNRMVQFFKDWDATLEEVAYKTLTTDARVDWVLMKNHIGSQLHSLAETKRRMDEVVTLIPFAPIMAGWEDNRRKLEHPSAKELGAAIEAVDQQIKDAHKSIKAALKSDNPPSKPLLRRASNALRFMDFYMREWFSFYVGYDPEASWWANKPHENMTKSLSALKKFINEDALGNRPGADPPIVGDPVGSEALQKLLDFAMIPYSAEELIEIGYKELAWCEREMKKAARDMGLGDDWQAAMERTKQDHVAPGKQDDMVAEMAVEAIKFLEDNQLVTVPELAKETWQVRMMSLEDQKFTPFFYYSRKAISVAYPTDQVTHEAKLMSMRANNRHFSRATVHHELIPGHFLQDFMTRRYKSYRSPYRTPFWGEGWALYWEMLLWDKNFQQSPENRMGMLFWRAHRCARIIVSLSFHLERMQPDEMISFLIDRVGHEKDSATAEVRRFVEAESYGPLYQCAYMIGGLQFRALHKDLVASGKMSNRDFHDAILRENRIPVEMVRALLKDQKLEKDFKTNWRFYDALD